jgi:hypothetical protein
MSPVMSQSNGSSPQPLLFNNFLTATSANQYDHHQHANQQQAQYMARQPMSTPDQQQRLMAPTSAMMSNVHTPPQFAAGRQQQQFLKDMDQS